MSGFHFSMCFNVFYQDGTERLKIVFSGGSVQNKSIMWLTSVEAKDVEWAAELSACLWCLAVGYFLPCHSGLNLALYSNEDWRQITFSCSRRIKNSSGHEVILLGKIDAHTHLANTKKKKGKRVWMRFGAQRLVKYCRHFFFLPRWNVDSERRNTASWIFKEKSLHPENYCRHFHLRPELFSRSITLWSSCVCLVQR